MDARWSVLSIRSVSARVAGLEVDESDPLRFDVSTTLQIYSHVTPAVEEGLADTVARLVDGESR